MLKRKVSLAGKRTPVSRLAGENSTTEPPMLITSSIYPAQSHIKYCIHVKNKDCIGVESNLVSRVAGENSTTEPPMLVTLTICHVQILQIEPRSPAWQAGILPLNHQCL